MNNEQIEKIRALQGIVEDAIAKATDTKIGEIGFLMAFAEFCATEQVETEMHVVSNMINDGRKYLNECLNDHFDK